jgi:tRNA-splicing ligase RtcB
MTYTGQDLIDMGYEPGPWFGPALEHINSAGALCLTPEDVKSELEQFVPPPVIPLRSEKNLPIMEWFMNRKPTKNAERENQDKVYETMKELRRTPTLVHTQVMPDACPAGPVGTIPVGGVAVADLAIHPGMHSADVCCSVMYSRFKDTTPEAVMDAVHKVTHFGPGGRPNGSRFTVSHRLLGSFAENQFLKDQKIMQAAQEFMGTQGDGNHFAYVGRANDGQGDVVLVTHHGSRGPGAGLYKLGMAKAQEYRRKISPETLKQNAWIPADTRDGEQYWEALQLIRQWTKANHNCLHQAAADLSGAHTVDRFWNEHNFVFQDGDHFIHAKGATPVARKYLPDSDGRQIIPLSMGHPILIVSGENVGNPLGFAPHGAGRNYSRTAHKRLKSGISEGELFRKETWGLDVRFYSGNVDISELPSAYKDGYEVMGEIYKWNLAEVVDLVQPYGSIMAGDWEKDMPWRKKQENNRD